MGRRGKHVRLRDIHCGAPDRDRCRRRELGRIPLPQAPNLAGLIVAKAA
jgi:hypothetical protein